MIGFAGDLFSIMLPSLSPPSFGSGIHGHIGGRSWGRIVFATNYVDVGPDRSVAAAAGSSGVFIISALKTCPEESAAGTI